MRRASRTTTKLRDGLIQILQSKLLSSIYFATIIIVFMMTVIACRCAAPTTIQQVAQPSIPSLTEDNVDLTPISMTDDTQSTSKQDVDTQSIDEPNTATVQPDDDAFLKLCDSISDNRLREYMLESTERARSKFDYERTRMQGIDVSQYQDGQFDELIEGRDDDAFVIVKVAAGKEISYDWKSVTEKVIQQKKLTGFYFFTNRLTVDSYNATEYAQWCAQQIEDYIGYGIVVLDHEDDPSLSPDWCLEWLEEFEHLTNVKPILYTNRGLIDSNRDNQKLQEIHDKDYGLWVAEFDTGKFESPLPWKEYEVFIHQFTSNAEILDENWCYALPERWWNLAAARQTYQNIA